MHGDADRESIEAGVDAVRFRQIMSRLDSVVLYILITDINDNLQSSFVNDR